MPLSLSALEGLMTHHSEPCFYEAMSIMDSWLLNENGISDSESLEPLTPNHLILIKSRIASPPLGHFVKDLYDIKRWRWVYLVEQFWSRWKRKYLLNLSRRQKWHTPWCNLKVNVVINKEDTVPRNQWHLGWVVETMEGSDGLVWHVKVPIGQHKTATKNIFQKVQLLSDLFKS